MIKKLIESDIPGLNTLLPEDWNYDYEKFLRGFLSDDFFHAFVMFEDDKIIGTGNVLVKDKIGWLANIIIDKEYRSRGLGLKMTMHLVDLLKHKGCETQLLVATDLGAAVYRKIGFKKTTDYQCFDTVLAYEVYSSTSIRKLTSADLSKVYEMDLWANSENREHLIDKAYGTGLGYFDDKNELQGCYLPDFGRGLILAKNKEVGFELLHLKHSEKGRRSLIPIENQAAIQYLEKIGLKKGDKSARMILGKDNHWKPEYVFSYGSGYCG